MGSLRNLINKGNMQSSTLTLDYLMDLFYERVDFNKFAIKGGYALSKLLPKDIARTTFDIDIDISDEDYYSYVSKVLVDIGEFLISNRLITNYKERELVGIDTSGGIKYYLPSGEKLGFDIGLIGNHKAVPISLNDKEVNFITIEGMIADKLSAIFSRVSQRRLKDFYDVYCLSCNFDINLYDVYAICGVLDYSYFPFDDESLSKFKIAYDKLKLHRNDLGRVFDKPEFSLVLDRVRYLADNLNGGVWYWKLRRVQ